MRIKRFTILALVVYLLLILTDNALAFYNPQTGHWLTRDELEEKAGANIYEWAWNSPTIFIDTDGRQLLQFDAFIDTAVEVAPRVSVAGDGPTTTGTSGGPGTVIDVAPRPVGSGLYPPAPITIPQSAPQPKTQSDPTKQKTPEAEPEKNSAYYCKRRPKSAAGSCV